jgi:hypothetical protein
MVMVTVFQSLLQSRSLREGLHSIRLRKGSFRVPLRRQSAKAYAPRQAEAVHVAANANLRSRLVALRLLFLDLGTFGLLLACPRLGGKRSLDSPKSRREIADRSFQRM